MGPEITIAVITSIASLLVAIGSIVNSVLVSRQAARSTQALEALKFDLANIQSAQKISDHHLSQSLESLAAFIRALQRLKDALQVVLSAGGSSLDSRSALESAVECRQHIFAVFEANLANLNQEEADGAHRAKNRALNIEMHLRASLDGTSYVSELTAEQRQTLTEMRNDLTDIQNLLRDSRISRLSKRLNESGL